MIIVIVNLFPFSIGIGQKNYFIIYYLVNNFGLNILVHFKEAKRSKGSNFCGKWKNLHCIESVLFKRASNGIQYREIDKLFAFPLFYWMMKPHLFACNKLATSTYWNIFLFWSHWFACQICWHVAVSEEYFKFYSLSGMESKVRHEVCFNKYNESIDRSFGYDAQ